MRPGEGVGATSVSGATGSNRTMWLWVNEWPPFGHQTNYISQGPKKGRMVTRDGRVSEQMTKKCP